MYKKVKGQQEALLIAGVFFSTNPLHFHRTEYNLDLVWYQQHLADALYSASLFRLYRLWKGRDYV